MDHLDNLPTRLKRRGLVAGAAALCGALLAKLAGAELAEAGHIGSRDDVFHLEVGNNQGGSFESSTGITQETVLVANVGDDALRVRNLFHLASGGGSSGTGIEGNGGSANTGTGGAGVLGNGGASTSGFGGPGLVGVGGGSPSGTGGAGVSVQGGNAIAPGRGVNAAGGNKTSGPGPGGVGVLGAGGNGSGGGTTGTGVLGTSATGTGVHGTSGGSFTQGVLGAGTGNAHGVTGTSVNAFGLSGTSTNAKGFVGVNSNGNDFAGLFVGHGASPANNNAPGIFVKGTIVATGGKSAAVKTSKGLTLLYAVEAPEQLFEDVGTDRLVSGRARVSLDPVFAETIDAGDYQVFLTPRSAESKGLAAVARDGRGFSVQELSGGSGSYAFDWRVVAGRKDAPAGHRLANALDPDVKQVLERLPGPPGDRRPVDPAPPAPVPPTGPGRR